MQASKQVLSITAVTAAMLLLSGCGSSSSDNDSPAAAAEDFNFSEATIASVHSAITSGQMSCEQIVSGYLDRINTYDTVVGGTELNSVVLTNPNAIGRAIEFDQNYGTDADLDDQPLYCIPVLPKDNYNTSDMYTSGGATAFQYNQPSRDAYTIEKLRDAGAIILGKANMDELAFGFRGESSVRGLVKNAYDQTKGAGGSSTGTGASIAASLAVFGLGTDTGGSIRVPSSLGGLVGIRPSMRLVSQDGIMPLATWQDTGGPMCRTVEDCAVAMDVLVGFDESSHSGQREVFDIDGALVADEASYQEVTGVPESYTAFLDADALNGARIGVVRGLFGDNEGDNAIVQAKLNEALAAMEAAGATVEDVVIPDMDDILSNYRSMSSYEFARDMETYLHSWSSNLDGHLRTYQDFQDSAGYLERNTRTIASRNNLDVDLSTDETYLLNTVDRPTFVRPRILEALDNTAAGEGAEPYDVLLYPTLQSLAGDLGSSPSAGSANRLSPFSGFPALSMPAGMADEDDGVSPAQPVGFEILAREFDEATLISIAYSYQEVAQPRQAPTYYPELTSVQ
ncbi:amidase [Oceanobacter sp. 3_MG-2023]|jgi:Asp-tRNA(Asn)/Glu-tRNA(Gln) amidotransferase A subunit family amidase|uniref:amidase n=1 Tax=Oceanobacter sp. 3_MG-2023 TaxID=3062622 RepID=UPI0027364192|nr:amidase family protein [Oceanobacter sp. 3_MG-2023]MDP2506385.1 amidase family protein [Oceanobacter sp. 3_MG-2023]